jgi:hypothetical protein
MASRPSEPQFDVGHDGHQRRQARLGLSMTPAARLAWLENKLAEMRRLLGKARRAAAPGPAR